MCWGNMNDVSKLEAVRLVVWDLDETFWRGTLTEGGITEYVRAHHDIVIELARRGIMSSICSKNRYDDVMAILEESGIAEYFIFASINWDSKGLRLAKLIEDVQLRPSTVLFIDDNPLNRAEALAMVPGLQVADETFVANILGDLRFRGKDDSNLGRLKQYKLLEQKKKDEASNTASNEDFLRSCGIRVAVEHNVEQHIDRVIELINRTNQLNFTKIRVSEDVQEARQQVTKLLRSVNTQVGLVRVSDNYGDYGFVGFYALRVNENRLIHYCWSCRTLGMLVEYWLYSRLGSPNIRVTGEVLTDLHAARPPVDWIGMVEPEGAADSRHQLDVSVFLRGGCDLQSVAHFLTLNTKQVVLESQIARAGMPLRRDHSIFLTHAINRMPPAQAESGRGIAYEAEDFRSAIVERTFDLYLFSFWSDLTALYQHKRSGLVAPFSLPLFDTARDVVGAHSALADAHCSENHRVLLANLRRDYQYVSSGLTGFADRLNVIFNALSPSATKLVLLAAETTPSGDRKFDHFARLNDLIREVATGIENIRLLNVLDFIMDPEEFIDATHFNRLVYYRIYRTILDEMTKLQRQKQPLVQIVDA